MKLAERTEAVAPSATLAMAALAKKMRAEGVDVLNMSVGEPDFDTPENIRSAGHAAIDRGDTRYTPVAGTPALRQAVADYIQRFYNMPCTSDEVIVGCGGKQVLFNACAALLNPGDEALFGAPYWVSYPDMVRFTGAKPVVVQANGGGFLPKASDFEPQLNEKTRLVLLNSPGNPHSDVYSRADLEDIASLLRQYPDVTIISDDIYSGLVFDEPFVGLMHVAPDLRDRTLIATGVSKTYAMTGWRIGFGIGPKPLIGAMSRIQGASTSGACSVAQAAAQEALEGGQGAVESMCKVFATRRDRIVEGLRTIPGLEVQRPLGAFYAFPKVEAYFKGDIKNSSDLSTYLLKQAHVATVPGSAFGAEGYIRMSFACSEETIDEAVRRLKKALAAI